MLMIILISIEIAQLIALMSIIVSFAKSNKENQEGLKNVSDKVERFQDNISKEVKDTIIKQLILPPKDKQYIVLPVKNK